MGEFSDTDREKLVETHTLLKEHVRHITKVKDDHEARLRSVERKQNKILAVISLGATGFGATLSTFWQKLLG